MGATPDASLGPPSPNANVVKFEVPAVTPQLAAWTRDQLIAAYWSAHPRFIFLKKSPPGALLLDLGAGGGGLAFWREYLEPRRTDIRLYGIDLAAPAAKALYDEFAVVNLDDRFPFPDARFDAAVASHLLEHVKDPVAILAGISERLRPGARAYVEMPAPISKTLPTAETYRDRGWPMIISNFHDDATHRETMALGELVSAAASCGLECVESGVISAPFLEDTLVARGLAWKDSEILLYGYWSKTRWAQYAVLERIG